MTAYILCLPDGAAYKARFPDTDPASGVLTYTARPSRNAWANGQVLLDAFGIQNDLEGNGRDQKEDMALARAWIRAHPVTLIIVRLAHMLLPDVRVQMLDLARATKADLLLVTENDAAIDLLGWADASNVAEISERDVAGLLSKHTRDTALASPPLDSTYPQLLPRVDYPFFRFRCRILLSPDEFRQVDDLYCATFRRVHAAAPVAAEDLGTLLRTLLEPVYTPGEALTICRSAQAAMFTHGKHVKVNVPTLLNSVRDQQHRRLLPHELRLLRAYRKPWRGVAVVLQDAGLSRAQIKQCLMRDVSPDGDLLRFEPDVLSDDARLYLRAQRFLRLEEGAGRTSRLITQDRIQYALQRVVTQFSIPGQPVQVSQRLRKPDRWQRTIGCVMHELAGAPIANARPLNGAKDSVPAFLRTEGGAA